FDRPEWQLVVLMKSGCPMVDVNIYYDRIRRIYSECAEWRDKALSMIADLRPDVVILGSSNSYAFSEQDWRKGTADVLQRLATVSEVRLLRATPMLVAGGERRFDDVAAWQAAAVARFPNVSVVDMN